jgi:dTDP-4-amino-4,6-dideoxygalactose transaminase
MRHEEGPPIYVTRPVLPPLERLVPLLAQIWDSGTLTNGGPFHERLQARLAAHLGVPRVSLFANATLALMVALRQQGVRGEVITTPFTFAATAHAIRWAGAEPVFADIEPRRFTLDPECIERAITPRTTAILPVHCYGHPCEVQAIEDIARRHGLRVIYDAAHAFGVRWQGRSLLSWGDLAVLSFHATKVFNTFEGGAVVSRTAAAQEAVDRLKNFGIVDESTVVDVGLNGKMSEFNAALGLLQLETIDADLAHRRAVQARYRRALAGIEGLTLVDSGNPQGHNHAYCPLLVTPPYPLSRDELQLALRRRGVFARRYFHPLLSSLPMYRDLPSAAPGRLPVAQAVAQRVLCLPIHPALTESEQDRVIEALLDGARSPRPRAFVPLADASLSP